MQFSHSPTLLEITCKAEVSGPDRHVSQTVCALHGNKQNLAQERQFIRDALQHSSYRNAPVAILELLWVVLATKSHFYHTVTRRLRSHIICIHSSIPSLLCRIHGECH